MELRLAGVSAAPETIEPVVPKHTPGGVRIVVRAGDTVLSVADLARFLGPDFSVQGELSGPGFTQPIALPPPFDPNAPVVADPLVLQTPPVPIAGNYRLSNLRIVANGRTVLDVEPSSIPLKVIDQILVTQVTTRALTLDEIRAKGIVLDSDDYLGFEFTMGFKLDSKAVDLKFPVVFDRQGVAIPQPLSPPPAPMREGLQLPTVVPLMMEAEGPTGIKEELKVTMPSGQVKPITIPAVLVIPGNIGFLKQFFSAQLYVSNGAPVGSNLSLSQVQAILKLPGGADNTVGTGDDPLALPEIERDGRRTTQPSTMPVRAVGPDGETGTTDDVDELAPAQQAQAEFLLRGEKEGFHQIDFDLTAQLLGLPIGPVTVKGKATGGVLVRNASFNVTFTVPSVVRTGEDFTLRATVTNIGKGIGNDVRVTFTPGSMSGALLQEPIPGPIHTLKPGAAATLDFKFKSQATGKVVASYLRMDDAQGSSGNLKFAVGVGERGVPLSPDTLVLPTDVSSLPPKVVDTAMRVLGQAWSVANAPPGSLPKTVIRSNPQAVVKKALALAEAALRVTLGQSQDAAVRDLLYDFFAGAPVDPGFDQLLRTTEAGQEFVREVGKTLNDAAGTDGGGPGYEYSTARLIASAGPFVSFGWDGVKGDLAVVDAAGRASVRSTDPDELPALDAHNVVSAVLTPLGSDMMLGVVTQPTAGPYRWEFRASGTGTGKLSLTIPRNDGSFGRATWSGSLSIGGVIRVFVDPSGDVMVRKDAANDGVFETTEELSMHTLPADGPRLIAGAIIGPETLDGAGPWGFQTALIFDRVVGEASAMRTASYSMAKNSVRAARRQLSGRLVFAGLTQPEGPYVPARIDVRGIEDTRGVEGPADSVALTSRLGFVKPGLDPARKEFGGIVSGRVLGSDGLPLADRSVVYSQNSDLTCQITTPPIGLGSVTTDSQGVFELRYVRKDQCGYPFQLHTKDPNSGSLRTQTLQVYNERQQIVADFVMLAAGTVQGTVLNHLEQPVSGADVTVKSVTDPQIGAATKTDAQGHYSVSGITVGQVNVIAARGNGRGTNAGRIEKANVPAVVDVRLDGGVATVKGTVSTIEEGSNAAPLPAAGARVSYYLGEGASLQLLALATTNAAGYYEMKGLPIGPFTVKAEINTRDHASGNGNATVTNPTVTRNLTITLPAPTALGYIEGTVYYPDGMPAADVVVSSGQGSVLTTSTGSFRLPVIPSLTTHLVQATTRDRKRTGSTRISVQSPGEVATGARITLSGLGAIEFTVLDPLNRPLEGREVRLLTSPSQPCGINPKQTDVNGKVRYEGLPLGSVTAQVVSGGDLVDAVRGTFSVSLEGETKFEILKVETRPSTITGYVVDSTGRVNGVDVTLSSPTFKQNPAEGFCGMGSDITHRVKTGFDGSFRFTGIHPGRIYLTATDGNFRQTTTTVVKDIGPGQTLDLPITLANTTSGEITGVVYEPDGSTSAGAGVEVSMTGPLPEVKVQTNAAGEYKMPKIFPAGAYQLTARDLTTGLLERTSIYVTAGQDARHDIRLKGQATVVVKVVTALDQPVDNAYVILREIAFPARALEAVVSPATGGFATFEKVFEGQVSIEVKDPLGRTGASGRAALTIPIGSARVETTVRVTTTGTVRGRFLKPVGDDSPIPYGSVQLTQNGKVLGQLTTSAAEPVGSFEFLYVPAGQFTLQALDPLTGRTGVGSGIIDEEGEVVVVDVRAQAIGKISGHVKGIEAGSPEPVNQGGAHVEITSGKYSASTVTDGQGFYSVAGVPEGAVVVTADLGGTSSGGFRRGSVNGTLTGEGGELTLDVLLRDAGNISGRLFRAKPADADPEPQCEDLPDVPDDQLPAGCVPASVASVTLYVGGTGGGTVTGSTGTDGRFSFEGVPSGDVRLTFESLSSDDFAIVTVNVPPGGDSSAVVHLNGLGTLEGQGFRDGGQVASGALVYVYGGPTERTYSHPVYLDANGRFTWSSVPAGPFTAQMFITNGGLTLSGSASGTVKPLRTESFSIQVQDTKTITGRVMRSNGTTLAIGSTVKLSVGSRPTVTIQAQNDGRFTFRAVPLEAFILNVNDPITAGFARRSGPQGTNGQVVDLGDIVLDDSPIQVVSVTPADGSVGVPVNQSVTITFSDALSYYQSIGVTSAGVSAVGSVQPSSDFKSVTIIPAGFKWPNPKTLTIQVPTTITDEFGRHPAQAFTSTFQTVDSTAPVPVSFEPANNAFSISPTASMLVTFDEPITNIDAELGQVVMLRHADAGNIIPSTATREGSNAIRLIPNAPLAQNTRYRLFVTGARDAAGNVQQGTTLSVFTTTDTTAPTLSMAPSSGSASASPRVRVSITVNDAHSGFSTANPVGLTVDGVTMTNVVKTAGGFYFDTPVDWTEGRHDVTAFADDNAGNRGTMTGFFYADRSAPTNVALTLPTAGAIVSNTFAVAASAIDAVSAIQRIDLYEMVNGSPTYRLTFPSSFTDTINSKAPVMSEGPHTYFAKAWDLALNSADSAPVTFSVDNYPVVVTITEPTGGSRVQSSVTVKAQASEAIQRMEFVAHGVTVVDATPPYEATFDLSAAPESSALAIEARAFGLNGEISSSSVTIGVDRTPPGPFQSGLVSATVPPGRPIRVQGLAGAAEPGAIIEFTNTRTGESRTAPATATGDFIGHVAGLSGDAIAIVQIDPAGNRGPTLSLVATPVASIGSLPTGALALWLTSDTGTRTTTGPIATWLDQSPSANNLTQASLTAQPKLVTDAFNNLPVVRFDGSDHLAFAHPLTSIGSVFWVIRDTSGDSAARYWLSNSAGTPNDFVPGSAGEQLWSTSFASPRILGGQSWVNGSPVRVSDSGRPREMSTVSLLTTGSVSAGLVGSYMGLSQFFKGDIAEMVIYERVVTADERRDIESYLMSKYGIPPSANPQTARVDVDVTRVGVATPNVEVSVETDNVAAEGKITRATSDLNGRATFVIPAGNLRARIVDRGVTHEVAGFGAPGETLSLALDLPPLPTSLYGVVKASDGMTPIEGLVVQVGAKVSTTDSTGAYRIDLPDTGNVSVYFRFQGDTAVVSRTIVAGADNLFDYAHPYVPVHSIAIAEMVTGAMVPGVSVSVCSVADLTHCAPLKTTDENGVVRYVGHPTGASGDQGAHRIRATASDGASVTVDRVFTASNQVAITLLLEALGRVHGTVTLPGGIASAGLIVTAKDDQGGLLASTTTSTDGSYEFRRLGGRQVTIVTGIDDGVIEVSRNVLVEPGDDKLVDLVLPVAVAQVTLVDESGHPLPNETVDFMVKGPRTLSRVTDAQGAVTIPLPAGGVRIVAQVDPVAADDAQVEVGDVRQLTIQKGSHHPVEAMQSYAICAGRSDGAGECSTAAVDPAQTFFLTNSGFHVTTPAEAPVNLFRTQSSGGGSSQEGLVTWAQNVPVHMRKRIYVPADGSFARSLASFTNDSDAPRTVYVVTGGDPRMCCLTQSPSSYFVYEQAYAVLHGETELREFSGGTYRIYHSLVIPPHSTRSILTFTTTQPELVPGLVASPAALDGLSDEDRINVVNFDLPSTYPRLISGRVFASNGVTPLAGAVVTIGGVSATADANGHYSMELSHGGSQDVHATFKGLMWTQQAAIAGHETTVNVVHDSVHLYGVRVTTGGSEPEGIEGAPVRACLPAGAPCSETVVTGAEGSAAFVGLPIEIGSSWYEGQQIVEVSLPGGVIRRQRADWSRDSWYPVEVIVDREGSIQGRVVNEAGLGAAGAIVRLLEYDEEVDRAFVGADGTYAFGYTGGRDFRVEASDPLGELVDSEPVSVPLNGSIALRDLILPVSILTTRVEDAAHAPIANALVRVTILDRDPSGGGGPLSTLAQANSQGVVSLGLSPGHLRVVFDGPSPASAETTLLVGVPQAVTLTAGSHHAPAPIGEYIVCGSGACSTGSTHILQMVPGGSETVALFQSSTSSRGTFESGVVTWAAGGINFRQTVFVPSSGTFARALTTFTNTTDADLEISIPIATSYEIADGGPEGYVTFSNGTSFIFGNGTDFECGSEAGCVLHQYIFVPAHESRSLLSFTTTTHALVIPLLDLAAAGATYGLTETDRAQIANFDVPPTVLATVEGEARSATGTPLAGATVLITSGETILAQGIAGTDGTFSIPFDGLAGTYHVVFLLGDHVFEGSVEISANGVVSLGVLHALPRTTRGSARLVIEDGSGGSVSGLQVTARASAFFGFDSPVNGNTDGDGVVVLDDLIPGLNRIETPLGSAFVRVVAGEIGNARLRKGPGEANAVGRVTLVGRSVAGAVVRAVQYDGGDTPSTVAEATTDPGGRYELHGLTGPGSINVYAWDPDQYRNTSGYSEVHEPTSDVLLDDLQLASDSDVGSVRIQGSLEASGLPSSGYNAVLQIRGTPFRLPLTLDGAGEATVHGLPGGNPIDVSIDGAGGHGREGVQSVSLETVTARVPVGERVDLPLDLGGFRYHGTTLEEVPSPYSLAYVSPWASLGDVDEPGEEPASTHSRAGGREFSNSFRTTNQSGYQSPLRLVRRVYIPPDGRFARIVDTLENVGGEAAPGKYYFDHGFFLPYSWTEVLGDGSIDVSDPGFVLMAGDASAAYGVALRGEGDSLGPSSIEVGVNHSTSSWTDFSLNPGEKKSFMTFIALGRDASATSVLARIQALLDLSDPLALEGLSAADRALIVNWILQ